MGTHSDDIRRQQRDGTGEHEMPCGIHIERVKILVVKQFSHLSKVCIGLKMVNNYSLMEWLIFHQFSIPGLTLSNEN